MTDSDLNSAEQSLNPSERPYSPAVERLAARFGMSKEAVNDILNIRPHSAPAMGSAPSGQAEPATTPLGTLVSEPSPIAEQAKHANVPSGGTPVAPVSAPPGSGRGSSSGSTGNRGVLVTLIVLVLLIGLVVALSLTRGCFQRRQSIGLPTVADSAKSAVVQPHDSASVVPLAAEPIDSTEQVNDTAVVSTPDSITTPAAKATPNHTTKRAKHHAKQTTRRTVRATLQTSSALQAEERLADYRAAGNGRAHIKTKHVHGTKIYLVYPR